MEILASMTGILLRLGIPVVFTVGIGWILLKLDARWQEESGPVPEQQTMMVPVRNSGCWNQRGCSEKAKQSCPAYQNQEMPCWQARRLPNGNLREGCLLCKIFKEAPIPVTN